MCCSCLSPRPLPSYTRGEIPPAPPLFCFLPRLPPLGRPRVILRHPLSSPVTRRSRASLGCEARWGWPFLWYSQVYSPASLLLTAVRGNSAQPSPSMESGGCKSPKTSPPFLRAKLTSLVGAQHCRLTLLRAGTTELGQARREGLGRGPGRRQSSGLEVPAHLPSGHPGRREREVGPGE